MKRRLSNSPLAQPESVLARQQSVAQKQSKLVVEGTLVVVARIVLQDMTNVLGVRDEVATARPILK
jgi:hypothetical protein